MDSRDNIHILYIEDDPKYTSSFRDAVEQHGHTVDLATTGEDGILRSKQNQYDLVAISCQLSDLPATDIAKTLLADEPYRPLIMVTRPDNSCSAIEALSFGIVSYVVKDEGNGYNCLLPGMIEHLLNRAEQARSKDTNHETAEMFRDLTEGSIQGIFIHDGTTSLFANPAYAEIFGYNSPEELLQNSTPRYHAAPHERERLAQYAKIRLDGGEAPTTYEFQGLKKDGSLIWLNNRVRPIMWNGQPAAQLTVVNVTDRKEMEESLRQSVESYRALADVSPVGIFRTDAEGSVTFVNEKWCELGGVSHEDSLGDGWFNALHPDDLTETKRLWKIYVTGNAGFSYEQRYRGEDGHTTVCISQATPEYDDNGNVVGHVGIITDITDQKKTEQALIDAQTQLRSHISDLEDAQVRIEQEAEKQIVLSKNLAKSRDDAEAAYHTKSEFLATMSHELRTPLTSIKGSLKLLNTLAADELSKDNKHLLNIAMRNGEAMLILVNELLDYEKIRSGSIVIETRKHNLSALTAKVVIDNHGYADSQSVRFDFKDPGGPMFAMVQEHRFEQVLRNLLSNAAKFSYPDSTVEIFLTEDDRNVCIGIRDKGPGIAEEFRASIFEQFYQIDSSSTRQQAGTGLGLPISKALVEGMNGVLWLESELGFGSVFFVNFPKIK